MNKIQIPYYEISNTIYVTVRDGTSKVWNTVSEAFEVWEDSNIVKYAIAATYRDGLMYDVLFPATILDGNYIAMIFIQGGVNPVVAEDIWIGSTDLIWDIETQTLSSGSASTITIERSPKVQVKKSENITITTVPAEVEILPETVQRTSEGSTSPIKRTSSSQIN